MVTRSQRTGRVGVAVTRQAVTSPRKPVCTYWALASSPCTTQGAWLCVTFLFLCHELVQFP